MKWLPLLVLGCLVSACGSDPVDPSTKYVPEDVVFYDVVEAGATADIAAADSGAPAVDVTADGLPRSCEPGETTCIDGKKATCDAKYGWLLEACPEGMACQDGECVSAQCVPLTASCAEGGVQICAPDGNGWSEVMPCPDGQACQEGVCIEPECEPGQKICAENKVLMCTLDGMTWTATPCEEGEVCIEGQCIECIKDDECSDGLSCINGECSVAPLLILTTSLPDGKEGQAYETMLLAEGGSPPLSWDLTAGDLPPGVSLHDDGLLDGDPQESGDYEITVEVSDSEGDSDQRDYAFSIFSSGDDLLITTGSPLPTGEEGEPYGVQLEATGGVQPYFWGIAEGALPAGLDLSSSGSVDGVPADHGEFLFSVKVFDNGDPVSLGQKEFSVTIEIAPLEILGDQEFDLFITKIIVLPLLAAIEGIPLPYSTELKAKGGVKPYVWSENPLPGFISYLIPNGGLPQGLVLDPDGTLHGSVTDPSQAVNVQIPFTQIDLTGFFFLADVEDDQNPPDSDNAIYLIPTLPVAF